MWLLSIHKDVPRAWHGWFKNTSFQSRYQAGRISFPTSSIAIGRVLVNKVSENSHPTQILLRQIVLGIKNYWVAKQMNNSDDFCWWSPFDKSTTHLSAGFRALCYILLSISVMLEMKYFGGFVRDSEIRNILELGMKIAFISKSSSSTL